MSRRRGPRHRLFCRRFPAGRPRPDPIPPADVISPLPGRGGCPARAGHAVCAAVAADPPTPAGAALEGAAAAVRFVMLTALASTP